MSAYNDTDSEIQHEMTGMKRGRPAGSKNKKPT